MYIGEVSKLTGATPKAIQHYKAISLINHPKRIGKYRSYSANEIVILKLIKKAQEFKFKLSELQVLTQKIGPDNKISYKYLIDAIQKKQNQLDGKITQLADMYNDLEELKKMIQSEKKCPYE